MNAQLKLIQNHRDLTAEEVSLLNEVKATAEKVRQLVDRVARSESSSAEGEPPATVTNDPGRAVAIARTELQTGFMWLVQSITRPAGF